jgi:hypothetical protein
MSLASRKMADCINFSFFALVLATATVGLNAAIPVAMTDSSERRANLYDDPQLPNRTSWSNCGDNESLILHFTTVKSEPSVIHPGFSKNIRFTYVDIRHPLAFWMLFPPNSIGLCIPI